MHTTHASQSSAQPIVRRGLWFSPSRPKPQARHQLFCFPYAGSGAGVYSRWQNLLPDDIDVWCVELPGHQSRSREPLEVDLPVLADQITTAIADNVERPFSLLGCSLGALLAFEVARRLTQRQAPLPERLIALACNAPEIVVRGTHIHKLPEPALVQRIAELYGPLPPALLALPKMRELVLRVLRADLQLVETYAYRPGPRLPFDLSFYSGTRDHSMLAESEAKWRGHTSRAFRSTTIEGGHLFVNEALPELLPRVLSEITRRH